MVLAVEDGLPKKIHFSLSKRIISMFDGAIVNWRNTENQELCI